MESRGLTDKKGFLVPHPDDPDKLRNVCSVMQYLMSKERPLSHLLIVDTDIIRFWHQGGGLLYKMYDPKTKTYQEAILGPDIDKGHVQQLVIPAGYWAGGQLLPDSEYAYLCEVVAPGFDAGGV